MITIIIIVLFLAVCNTCIASLRLRVRFKDFLV